MTSQSRELSAAKNRIAKLEKDLGKRDAQFAALRQEIDQKNRRIDHFRSLSRQLETEKNELDRRLAEAKKANRTDDPMGQGAFEIRTKREQLVAGRMRPAGTRLAFFTAITGIMPSEVVDSVHYGTGLVVPAEHHELYTELMARGDVTEKLAAAEIQISELTAKVETLEAELDELDEDDNDGDDAGGEQAKAGEKKPAAKQ